MHRTHRVAAKPRGSAPPACAPPASSRAPALLRHQPPAPCCLTPLAAPPARPAPARGAAVRATATATARAGAGLITGFKQDQEPLPPAFAATLRMLEWRRVCEHLAEHASTRAGKEACLGLGVPPTEEGTQQLLGQTRCVGRTCARAGRSRAAAACVRACMYSRARTHTVFMHMRMQGRNHAAVRLRREP